MLLLTVIISVLSVGVLGKDTTACASACQSPLSEILFNGSPATADYYTLTYSTCGMYGDVHILPWSIISNITDQQFYAFPHVTNADLYGPITYNTPVFVSDSLFKVSLKTEVTWDDSLATRANYGYALYGFFGIVILIGVLCRAIDFIAAHGISIGLGGKFHRVGALSKRHISLPALISHRAAAPGMYGIVPTRLQSFTVFAFVVINIVLCCVNYQPFEGNLFWSATNAQIWRYVSDRTGVLSISNIPLIWAFSMRNNVLIWATGWSFSTFNVFHRWVARIATIEAIVHSIGYTVFSFVDGGKAEYTESWSEQYWWMGVIATIAMSFLCLFSIYPARRYTYELFLILHIGLATLFLISMWYHVAIFAGQYNVFIWPCVAVWSFDRALRLGRLLSLNLLSLEGVASYNPNADVVRVRVPTRQLSRPHSGTYYYLYLFHGYKIWESHPFTLKSWGEIPGENSLKQQPMELSFMFRPRAGFTSRFRDHLLRQTAERNSNVSEISIRLALEGPYGTPYDISRSSSVLFIIGGSGITVALAHLQSLQEALHETKTPNRDPMPHSVRLVWAVRNRALFEDVTGQELSEYFAQRSGERQLHLQMDIHITKPSDTLEPHKDEPDSKEFGIDNILRYSPEDVESKETGGIVVDKSTDIEKLPSQWADGSAASIQIYNRRPVVRDLVLECAEEWQATQETMTVVCCGPGAMVDDARAAVVTAAGRGYDKIEFRPEMFHL